MNLCSLGLACDADSCPNLESCESIAAPWQLPYEYYEPTNGRLYCILRVDFEWWLDWLHEKGRQIFDADGWDAKQELDKLDREIYQCSVIISELKEAGWADPISIHQ